MANLSVVIITYNEEKNIGRAIDAVTGLADDIVVVDDFSTDATPAICRERGVTFHQKSWEGYGKNKNFANSLAKNNWILSIDADEVVSEELQSSIKAAMEHPDGVYELPFMTNYCGKWIRHGKWYPEYHIRLFNRQEVKWNTDDVHEGLLLPDHLKVTRLKGHVLHYSFSSLQHHVQKINAYSALAAEKMYKKGKKPTFIKLYISPVIKFKLDYFFRLGCLDGFYGFCITVITSFEAFLKYARLRELYKRKKAIPPDRKDSPKP